MANKKISQLTAASAISAGDLFAMAGNVGGGYITEKVDATGVAEYTLNPISATQVSGLNKNFFINNNNSTWDTAGSDVELNPYLQVRQTDGQLVTGSGISVPSVGDNMGNCQATKTLDMQANWLSGANFSVTGLNDVYFNSSNGFYGPRIEKGDDPGTVYDLKVQAGQDLTLSGIRHVHISGQALSLENEGTQTPISGNVIITGGNVEIDPAHKLIANEITITKDPGFSSGVLSIEGASYHDPHRANFNGGDLYWDYSNIQYSNCNPLSDVFPAYAFQGVADGQTLTMCIRSTRTSGITPAFTHTANVPVVWGGEYNTTAPELAAAKTNLYTFVRINTGIFASAVTGYDV
jgi:hypothetical protein